MIEFYTAKDNKRTKLDSYIEIILKIFNSQFHMGSGQSKWKLES